MIEVRLISANDLEVETYLKQNDLWHYFVRARQESRDMIGDQGHVWFYLELETPGKVEMFQGFGGFDDPKDNGYVHLRVEYPIGEKEQALTWIEKFCSGYGDVSFLYGEESRNANHNLGS